MMVNQALVIVILTWWLWWGLASAVEDCCPEGSHFLKSNNSCSDGSEIQLYCEYGTYYLDSVEDADYFSERENDSFALYDVNDAEYCISLSKDNESLTPRAIAVVCFSQSFDTLDWVTTILMMISLPFLVITIVVYSAIPALRDLNGKCIIGYLLSLTVSYIVFISRALKPVLELCALRGAFLYFSTISMFTWLNLVTFNVWKSVRNKVFQMTDKKLFYVYLGWSVGIPLGLSFIVFILDLIPGTPLRGHFSLFDCWYEELLGFWVLFYTPMIILVVLNTVMVAHCCWILWRGYRDPNQTRIRTLRFKCLLTLRLFFLSGVPWTFDMISMLVEEFVELRYLWFVFDCINSAQGIVIFLLLVVYHKRVLRAVQQHNFLALKWPERWGERDADSVSLSEIDKVAMEQMKENNP